MGIVGNGASINTLMEAGVKTADIMIAVTASDELNLLCCLIAQKTGHCQTIARVRNPIYSKEIGFIQERLGLSMIINPELTTAREISRLLRFPAAIKIDPFSKGRVELLKFKVLPEFELDGMSVSQITDKYIKHPLEAVSVGDIVDVKVMSVDLKKKRIQLTMRGI